jgi:hypothetical protein
MTLQEDLEKSRKEYFNTLKVLKLIQRKEMSIDMLRSTKFGKTISGVMIKLKKVENQDEILIKCLKICEIILENWKDVYKS